MKADVSISEYKMADQLKTVVIASVIGATLAGKECCGAEEVVPDGVTDEVTSDWSLSWIDYAILALLGYLGYVYFFSGSSDNSEASDAASQYVIQTTAAPAAAAGDADTKGI